MSKPTTQDVLDHLMEHYNDLSIMSKQLLGVARQVLVTHDAILELTGSGPIELGISRERLRELIEAEEDLPVEVGSPFSPHMGPGRTAAPFNPPDARRELIPVARFVRAEDSAALEFRVGDVFLRDLPPGPYVVYRAENPEAPAQEEIDDE